MTPLSTQGLVGSFLRDPGPTSPTGELSTPSGEVSQLLGEGARSRQSPKS